MAAHSKTLFSSLVGAILAGDMLIVPIGKPFVEQETAYFATVLRVDSDGWVYLSWFSDDPQHTSTRMAPDGPFRWSDEQLALVDRKGDVPITSRSSFAVPRRLQPNTLPFPELSNCSTLSREMICRVSSQVIRASR